MGAVQTVKPMTSETQKSVPTLKDRLIVALDVPTVDAADKIVRMLGDSVDFYKVGLQLQFAAKGGGLRYADGLIQRGKKVFLDSKLFDISETVERTVENVARMGVRFLTVHGNGKTIEAAIKGRGASGLQILSVTVLTSLDIDDLRDLGYTDTSVKDLVLHRAKKALEAGADGVIASGEEVEVIRQLAANKLKIITPGIRRKTDYVYDQKRVATPTQAIIAGADHLVVGRPITQASDPRRAVDEILVEVSEALGKRTQP